MPGTAVTNDRTVSMPSPASRIAPEADPPKPNGPAVDAPERFAWAGEIGFPGSLGIEPGTLYPLNGAVIAGNGGDQCREAVDAIVVAMEEIGMKPQGREAAMADGAGLQIGFLTVIAGGVIAAIGGSGQRQ